VTVKIAFFLIYSLTISAFQAGVAAFGQRSQAEAVQVKLPTAVAFTHRQALSVQLADLRTETTRRETARVNQCSLTDRQTWRMASSADLADGVSLAGAAVLTGQAGVHGLGVGGVCVSCRWTIETLPE